MHLTFLIIAVWVVNIVSFCKVYIIGGLRTCKKHFLGTFLKPKNL